MNKIVLLIGVIVIALICYFAFTKYTNRPQIKYKIKNKFKETVNPILKNLDETYTYIFDRSDLNYLSQRLNDSVEAKNTEVRQIENAFLLPQQNTRDIFVPEVPEFYFFEEEINIRGGGNNDFLDSQTIHDTYVQKKITNEYKGQGQVNKPSAIQLEDSIEEFIKNKNLRNDKNISKIKGIISKIKNRNSYVSNISDYEYNVLENTWNKAGDDTLIKEEIINQLEDCIDNGGMLYCPTGVCTRIIQSKFIKNPQEYPKTKELINQEMLNIASKFQEDNPNLSDEDFKEKLIEKYCEEYKNLMTKKQIKEQIADWIDYI
jgi:hypothetical protein